MNMIKSLYVSAFLAGGFAGFAYSLYRVVQEGLASPWLGAAIACAGPALFFGRLFVAPAARTSRNLPWMFVAGFVGLGVSLIPGAISAASVVALSVGVIGVALYVFWYSKFDAREAPVIQIGQTLPAFTIYEGDAARPSTELMQTPALWIFYRGNWCPLCMAQIKEVAAQYRELAQRGVEVYLISPQPESHSAALAKRMDAPMRFMTDRNNSAARILGVIEPNGLPAGMQVLGYDSDVPRPTVFVTATGGKVIYCDLTENYRVRPEPSAWMAVLDGEATRPAH
ncbi:redoxin domain-containing protein [Panacagrimonas sp.]|uniref:redoxin domain-containing protein n=1 Tax=Panacagrimonas sp. TaxID=2480088 RepID=UPI003B52013D